MNKTDHSLYLIWNNIRSSCYNRNYPRYPEVGAKGIKVEWDNFWDFAEYLEHNLGPRPARQGLRRIDPTQNYKPGNVEWAKLGRPAFIPTDTKPDITSHGVVWDQKKGRAKPFKAQISIDRKMKHLGYFETELQAAQAYDEVAKKLGKNKINFPESS